MLWTSTLSVILSDNVTFWNMRWRKSFLGHLHHLRIGITSRPHILDVQSTFDNAAQLEIRPVLKCTLKDKLIKKQGWNEMFNKNQDVVKILVNAGAHVGG